MRSRATVSYLVTMILIAVSCAASACSVRCDLHTASPSCHNAAHGQDRMMAAMFSGAHVAPHAMTAPCEQHVCVERPALLRSDSAAATHLHFLQQAPIVTLIEWPAARSLPTRLSDPPPPPSAQPRLPPHSSPRIGPRPPADLRSQQTSSSAFLFGALICCDSLGP